eukprot:9497184-Pyramimonas_sp.AAC.1
MEFTPASDKGRPGPSWDRGGAGTRASGTGLERPGGALGRPRASGGGGPSEATSTAAPVTPGRADVLPQLVRTRRIKQFGAESFLP